MTRRTFAWTARGAIIAALGIGAGEPLFAQNPPPAGQERPLRPGPGGRGARAVPQPLPQDPDVMSVQQVEQYFDYVVLDQARRQLQLSEEQFLRFGARLQRLQTARRQMQRRRAAIIRDLNGLMGPNAMPDDTVLSAKVRELDEANETGAREIALAYTGIDEVLSIRQRARFRVFEEMMERRKLDLLARARERARGGQP